jgi:uncharacterized membrane protein
MWMTTWALVILLSLSPISELRGAVPYGILSGLTPWKVAVVASIFNAVVFWGIVNLMDLFYENKFKGMKIVKKVMATASKASPLVKSKGYWGLLPLVAIPLPVTGVWTASILTWVFGINRAKAFGLISGGVAIACVIVYFVVMGAIKI